MVVRSRVPWGVRTVSQCVGVGATAAARVPLAGTRGWRCVLSPAQPAFRRYYSKEQKPEQDQDGKKDELKHEPEDESKHELKHEPAKKEKPKILSNSNQEPQNPLLAYLNSSQFRVSTVILLAVILGYYMFFNTPLNEAQFTFQDFKTKYLEKGLVQEIIVDNGLHVQAKLIPGTQGPHGPFPLAIFNIGLIEVFEEQLAHVQDKLEIPLLDRIPVIYTRSTPLAAYLMPFVPTVLIIGGLVYLNRSMALKGGGMGGMGAGGIFNQFKSKAKRFNAETDVKVMFKDVVGCDESKEEIVEFVHFLKDPQRYERLGARIPRGAVLSGPPGTGKTLLAKATAGEAGVPFLLVSGSEFVEMFVGVGALRVRDLFKEARLLAPLIIFIDEIDAIGKKRGGAGAMGGNDEKEATLNQILVEMDGFNLSEHVIVLAGTNRADALDPALLRPGRFDRHVYLDVPDIEGRKAMFQLHAEKLKLKVNLDQDGKAIAHLPEDPVPEAVQALCGRLAALTPGFSGADIANACNEAALVAARQNAPLVEYKHFELAIERVIAGMEKRLRVLLKEERRTVAYHEAGHAICGWFLEFADPLLKVLIVPRGPSALGYAQYLPPDQYLVLQEQFRQRMVMTLGGRVSEELHFDTVTAGAQDDFRKVLGMARAMVLHYGMLPKLGEVLYAGDDQLGFKVTKPFSQATGQVIDLEVKRMIDEAYAQCRALLTEKLALVDMVAEELLRKEVITRDDMLRLLGPRPFEEKNDAFNKYIGGVLDPDGPAPGPLAPDSPAPAAPAA